MKRILKSIVLLLGVLMLPTVAYAQNIYGDVNGDLEVNIADVNAVIDVILNDATILTADVNQDGEINIADINVIIDIILNGDDDDQFSVLCERASEIDWEVLQYYEQCESLDEMMQHADAIRALDDVEAVYSNGTTTMFVKIKDFFTLMYSFYPGEYEEANNQAQQRIKQIQDVISQNSNRSYGRNGLEGVKFLAVNQQTDWDWSVQSAATACSIFEELGFESDVKPSPNVEFFTDGIFDCDYLFIITHGCYDINADIHWLSTSVPVERNLWGKIKKSFLEKYKNYGADEVAFEVENIYTGEAGPIENKSRVKVSEHLIKNKSTRQFRHPGKAVVFNVACQSMKGPTRTDSIHTGLAQAFIDRGACVYFGYDEAIVSGQVAGLEFWHRLAMGLTISDAINHLTPWLYHEYHDYHEGEWANYWADLTMHPKDTNFPIYVTQPIITYEDKSNDNILQIDLKATGLYTSHIQATSLNTWELLNDYSTLSQWGIDYGFELCEDDQFNEGVSVVDEKHCGEQGQSLNYLDYSCSLTYSPSDPDSKIKPGTTYWARAYMSFGDGYNYSEPITFTTSSISGGTQEHEYVDLGLPSGTLWATCNIGASTPEEYGDYFAWGETEPKESYNFDNYKWCNGSRTTMTKYCTSSSYGTVDNKSELDPEDDAAYVNWGPLWRMPSSEQIDELRTICTWQGTTRNGVDGQLVTGPNGNSLFLPTAGFFNGLSLIKAGWEGSCWSRTLSSDISNCAYDLYYDLVGAYWSINYREMGISVRAVLAAPEDGPGLYVEQQSLDLGEVPIGETRTGELTIINNSASLKTVIAVADTPFGFKEGESCVSSITVMVPSNSSGSVTIQFTATTPGDYSGNITFQNFALDGGQCVVPVQAHAVSVEPQGDYIDLGLPSGTLWATRNIGASNPEDYGDYFAWGETSPKEVYKWSTYKWCSGASNQMTKYCTQSVFGTVDGKTELDLEDDAAYVNWGPNWRMPSFDQQYELWQCCSRQWTTRNGVNGELVTGPNGNTLFFPASGEYDGGSNDFEGFSGDYWSRTLDSRTPNHAYGLYIYTGGMFNSGDFRCYGHTVRAVRVSQD